jgi:prepilin-type N-terminal cleavage/methylation domain-containing protein
MTLRFFRRFRPLQQGFSLIEMLVAVMFIGILTAGMLRVYSANLAGFQRVNDMIASQRRGRWALASLQDDAASIGYFALVPFNQPTGYSVSAGTQEPFMILPSPTPVLITGPDPANLAGPLVTAPLAPNPDELQFVGDLPLPIQATVSGTTPASLTVNTLTGSLTEVQPGDVVAILDAAFEQIQVGSVSGNIIGVSATGAALAGVTQAGGYALSAALAYHEPGTPIAIFRPNVVTRYSIQARPWDPSNPAITVPCLVRQQAPYPPGGTLISWAGATTEVIAENIDGFVVDLSFDGGATWLRQGSANWDAIITKISDQTPGGKSVTPRDANNPLWFRTFPFLMRMDITSRSAAPRSESASALGQAAYVRRTQSLMVAPRNFGLPL